MLFRLLPRFLLTAFVVAVTIPVPAQSVYHATQGRLDLSLGGGGSNFDPDFAQGPLPGDSVQIGMGQGHRWGFVGWADAGMPFGPPWVRGIGIEAEYRAVYAGDMVDQTGLKESTAGGGAIYTWRHWRDFRPYGKYIFSLGSIAFAPIPQANGSSYSQDSRAAQAFGGGFEVRCSHHIWARADYQYQSWGRFLGPTDFTPQGLSVGAMYSWRGSPRD